MNPDDTLDSHVHVWDASRFSYPWLEAAPRLPLRVQADELAVQVAGSAGVILVEAGRLPDQALAEARWLSELGSEPVLGLHVRGIVAHAPVELGARVAADLEPLVTVPRVVGVRRLLQSEPLELLGSANLLAGLRAVGEAGFPFDACVRLGELDALVRLVEAVPDTVVVLDHLGKPDIDAGPSNHWLEAMHRLADCPHVVVKLSGLVSEASGAWRSSLVLEHLQVALELFGPERAMIGSDWPVAGQQISHSGWLELISKVIMGLTPQQLGQVRHGTAERIYRLGRM